jgi:hypothetical protein
LYDDVTTTKGKSYDEKDSQQIHNFLW